MRVQCDVCENAEAAVMCCADEAALCAECDLNVHAANKLSIKHQRVPLLKDSDAPRCDICQEKTGFFFCLQDRALLCRNCDVSIHTANALSSSHRRFLVTGIRVALDAITAQEPSAGSSEGSLRSVTSAVSPPIANPLKASRPPPVSALNPKGLSGTFLQPVANSHSVSGIMSQSSASSGVSVMVSPAITTSSVSDMGLMPATPSSVSGMMQMMAEPSPALQNGYGNLYKRSSISEFLTEAIPGWRVDELLNLPDVAGGYTLADIASSKILLDSNGLFEIRLFMYWRIFKLCSSKKICKGIGEK
ncbi:hypothetical protein O6H91_03G102600 [Diphasiastrum complanatum]|uniref:Uncharacterized protein n=1 Tax=Diphasiastrum complanatum TaxID=34168 RepID=A0ACC2EA57_DIPCM|nr:hypothetical protein O6H91_03G102600 [Diphasiastrum complanatum]